MSFAKRYVSVATWLLPSPFTLAVLLSALTFMMAMVLPEQANWSFTYVSSVANAWQLGFWDLLTFAMQMMMILVLGHVLALTPPIHKLIGLITQRATTTAKAAFWVCSTTILVALLNWGLGLIFGAILARKVGEQAKLQHLPVNYPFIGACGYVGLMVWHGGLSGSATLKVSEMDHFLIDSLGQIPLSQTIFSTMNLCVSLALVLIVPGVMALIGSRLNPTPLEELPEVHKEKTASLMSHRGLAKLDQSPLLSRGLSLFMLLLVALKASQHTSGGWLDFLDLNTVNFLLFALGLWMLGSIERFSLACDEAISGAAGIMIQFPLYAGIAGMMVYSGLIDVFSNFILSVSSSVSFALWTFVSAAVVNVFVPSGGGQWAVQGPIIAQATQTLDVPASFAIMAFAYGDQLTNMMQPFWALPLLAITRLKASQIVPYTLMLLVVGGLIFTLGLLLFTPTFA